MKTIKELEKENKELKGIVDEYIEMYKEAKNRVEELEAYINNALYYLNKI